MVNTANFDTTVSIAPPDPEEERLLDLVLVAAADNGLMAELVQDMRNRTYELSTRPIDITLSLPGNANIGTVDLLGQAHSRPEINSTLTEINVGLAQARLYTQLVSGEYKHVFVEGQLTDLLCDDPLLQTIRSDLGERFATIFPEGVNPVLSAEQAQFFYEHGASTIYAATRIDVSLHKICCPEETAILYMALELGLAPAEMRNRLTMGFREGLAMREILHHLSQPGNEGTTVAWTMGALHTGAESADMHRTCGTTTKNELPVVNRHLSFEDMVRPVSQTVHTESQKVVLADDTVRAIWEAKAINRFTFKELTSVEQQVVGLLRLEVKKQDFPSAGDLKDYLMENRLCPAMVHGRCESVPAVSIGLSYQLLPPSISAGDEYQQEAYIRRQEAMALPSNASPVGKFFAQKVQLADPVGIMVELMFAEKAGPFSIYRVPTDP